jgi:glutamine amidotransferase-like uncharacterized protein
MMQNTKPDKHSFSELKTQNSKLKKAVAFLWDESFLWGLMAYKTLKANSLPFELIRSEDIKNGKLKKYKMLFVPGGWASNKLKALGQTGIDEIKLFVKNGGNYLGFCGGAGLATMDGIGLLNIKRKPTKDRVPSFSGRIHLNINNHPIWCTSLHNSDTPSPIFHAWWPSQFMIRDNSIKILATYADALPDAFSSDLNIGDVKANSGWLLLEELYKINLDPKRLLNEPAVVEDGFGKGKVVLSLIHFDTPDDINGSMTLRNLWQYLAGQKTENRGQKPEKGLKLNLSRIDRHASLIEELENAIQELIEFGERNFLWFWRNPMLLQWRRGVRGLEYCTLYVMIKETAKIIKERNMPYETKEGSPSPSAITDYALHIKKLLLPFTDKAKKLLTLERLAMQNGHITYERCDNTEIQKIRTELFSDSKSHGGLFKNLIDKVDALLYKLLKQN